METISPREKVLTAYVRAIGNRRALAGDPGELFALLDRIVIRSAAIFQDERFLRKVWQAIRWFAIVRSISPLISEDVVIESDQRSSQIIFG